MIRMMMQGRASRALHEPGGWKAGRSGGHSTGVHSIRTRSPGWLAVWQTTLAGSADDGAAAGVTAAAAGAATEVGIGSTGRARDDAS